MKPGKANKAVLGFSLLLALVTFISGCSSRSRLKIYVDSITGAEGNNIGREYLECDIIGSSEKACSAIQDMVNVTVRVDQPGILGPSLDVFITGYTLEIFYFDPIDGALKGPVPGLTTTGGNIKLSIGAGVVIFPVPVATFRFKTWSVGVDCNDLAGYAGIDNVSRFIARITVHAEDTTGKTMSADGSILCYLYDYAPGPLNPADSDDVDRTWCFGMTPEAYWSAICP